jgi:sigma-B regulation protein RsbU (phosphoserine phosphatase)
MDAASARKLLSVCADDDGIAHRQIEQLGALLDELDVGLVSVDSAQDFATINLTAAALLKVPSGSTTASEFTAIIRALANRAIDRRKANDQLSTVQHDPAALLRTTWEFADAPTHLGVVCKPAPYPGFNGRIWAFYDNSALAQAVEASERGDALLRAAADAMLDSQVLLEAVWQDGRIVDLIHRSVNRAACDYIGLSREQLIGRSIQDVAPDLVPTGLLAKYIACAENGEPVTLDDFTLYNDILGGVRYYDIRASQAQLGLINVSWRDVTDRSELTRRIAESEAYFRLLADNVADVVVRLSDEGRIIWISNSVEAALGAPPEFWIGRPAMEFAAPGELEAARERVENILTSKADIGRALIRGADGVLHRVHLHSKPFYDADGKRDGIIASFRVIDDEVAAEERAQRAVDRRDRQNKSLTQLLQAQTDRLMSDMDSAAKYVASILPGDLDGPVRVSSRYVSSRRLGGDSFDYRWIDDDHMLVYLLDVSGHGVEPAMVSVSVHNLLRSGSIAPEVLLQPDAVLAELNRLFQMERQAGNYFTIWYGVYQTSTRTLRYASAGHPPAIVLTKGATGQTATKLSTGGMPVGMFEDSEFAAATYVVPACAEVLVYSDGAFELDLPDGEAWSLPDFIELCAQVAQSPEWSLDQIIAGLRTISVSGVFDDDCTMVRITTPY